MAQAGTDGKDAYGRGDGGGARTGAASVHEMLLNLPAALRGPLSLLVGAHLGADVPSFRKYRDRLTAPAAPAPATRVANTPATEGTLAVHGVVFVRNPKTGSSSISRRLEEWATEHAKHAAAPPPLLCVGHNEVLSCLEADGDFEAAAARLRPFSDAPASPGSLRPAAATVVAPALASASVAPDCSSGGATSLAGSNGGGGSDDSRSARFDTSGIRYLAAAVRDAVGAPAFDGPTSFAFACVRHPLSRAVSAWRFCCPALSFEAFVGLLELQSSHVNSTAMRSAARATTATTGVAAPEWKWHHRVHTCAQADLLALPPRCVTRRATVGSCAGVSSAAQQLPGCGVRGGGGAAQQEEEGGDKGQEGEAPWRPCVDAVLRFEHLEEDFQRVVVPVLMAISRAAIPDDAQLQRVVRLLQQPLPREKVQAAVDPHAVFAHGPPSLQERVAAVYRRDLESLGYSAEL